MFLYLAERGRYWLRTVVATCAAFLFLGSVSPTLALAADPLNSWSQSKTNQEIFKPWTKQGSMPWNGNWKAFNSTLSERAGGTCALNESDQKALTKFRAGAEADYKTIQDRHDSGDKAFASDKMAGKFRDALNYRLGNNNTGKLNDGNDLGNSKSNIKQLFDANTVKSIGDIEDLQSLIANSPDFAACTQIHSTLDNLKRNVIPNPIVLFKEPARFIVQLLAFIPVTLATGLYFVVSYPAFGLLLSTPHSERGDTIFNSISYQAANGATKQSKLRPLVSASGQTNNAVTNEKYCNQGAKGYSKTDAELGFACQNLNDKNQESNSWIGIANGLRATLSAVYGIIVIAVALIYLFKRNAQSQYNLKVVMPRLFFAVLLSTTAPYLIGAVISLSNFILQAILSVQQGSLPAELHRSVVGLMNVQFGEGSGINLGGMLEALISILLPTIVLLFFTLCLFYFIFIAIAKQIALAALIILTPVACLSFVFRDSGKNLLALWAKGIVGISAIPIAVASVLVMGSQIANVFWNPADTGWGLFPDLKGVSLGSHATVGSVTGADSALNSLTKILAVISLCVSMVMAMKMIGKIRQWVTGSKVGMVGKSLGTATKIGGMAAGAAATLGGNPALGGLITSTANSAGNRMRNGSSGGRQWIPSSSSTFGSASAAAPGRDLTGSASRALHSFNKLQSMDRMADAAERGTSRPQLNSGRGEQESSGESTSSTTSRDTADVASSASQSTAAAAATQAGTSGGTTGGFANSSVGKGFAKMGSTLKNSTQMASSALGGIPGAGMLKNAFAGDSAALAAVAGTAVGGPLLGAVLASKAKGRRQSAEQAKQEAAKAAQEAAKAAQEARQTADAEMTAASTSGFGGFDDDLDFPVSLGGYGGSASENQSAAWDWSPRAQAQAEAQAQAAKDAAQAARDRALNRRRT